MVCAFGIYIFRCTGFCLSRVNCVEVYATFSVICALELVVLLEEGTSCLPIHSIQC